MVSVVTDSVSDIPRGVAEDLGITVIPLFVHFGARAYKDGVDLNAEQFYRKLETNPDFPKTAAPGPGVFAEVFDRLAKETNEILAVFVSRKFSTTYDAALQGIELMEKKCRVGVIDSRLGAMAEGLLVVEAAKKAIAGASLDELVDIVIKTIPRIHIAASFDTLKYLAKGGRIGKARALLGSMLRINPIIGIKDGEAFPLAKVYSRAEADEWLYKFVTGFAKVKALSIEHGNIADRADALGKRIASAFPGVPLYISTITPVIGAHTGPHVLMAGVLEEEE